MAMLERFVEHGAAAGVRFAGMGDVARGLDLVHRGALLTLRSPLD
jgi:hypothetical protein